MKEYSYLTFSLNNYLYGINIIYVEEIFALPDLLTIPEVPRGIIGFVNLRGELLPVIDLNLVFGYQSPGYHLTDSVVVLKGEELRLGIIINQVHEVRNISSEEITTEFDFQLELEDFESIKFITGVARIAGDIFILSNPENWLDSVETKQVLSLQTSWEQEVYSHQNVDDFPQPVLYTNATLEDRTLFRQQTDHLKNSTENQDLNNFTTLAVISLNSHLFGIDLEMVREFVDIAKVTPVPCCPSHIIGNMNLRGEILTLVDIRGLLNLQSKSMDNTSKAMVVEVEGIIAGVIVEEICDVMFSLNLQKVKALPATIHATNHEYFQGTTFYHEKIMNILNMPKIFLEGGLIVDEAI